MIQRKKYIIIIRINYIKIRKNRFKKKTNNTVKQKLVIKLTPTCDSKREMTTREILKGKSAAGAEG